MRRPKLLSCTVAIAIAAAGVSAGPLTASSAAEPAKATKPATTSTIGSETYVNRVKTSDKQQAAVLSFVRG
jgi:hypothetical protein